MPCSSECKHLSHIPTALITLVFLLNRRVCFSPRKAIISFVFNAFPSVFLGPYHSSAALCSLLYQMGNGQRAR